MRAEALALLCLSLGACAGADLIVGDGRAADSGIDSSAPVHPDASAARPEFEPPRVIAELESEDVSDDDPSLTADLLVLCFNSKREAGMGREDIWCSRRARADEVWGAPEPQTTLNSEHRETGIALSFDGLSLWFSSDRADDEGLDVYLAIRPTRDSAWSEPARVPELSSQHDDLVSSIDESEQRLMLARRMRTNADEDSEDDYDLFLAERATRSEPWQPPSPVTELNTDAAESDAFLIGTGLQLLFTRNADLMLAQRARQNSIFEQPEALDALNSDERERDAWSNDAFTYVVFSSDRAGSFRLYESNRVQTQP